MTIKQGTGASSAQLGCARSAAGLRADDGDSEVPAALGDAVRSVVVIGAGVAGLTAAQGLARAGCEVTVLEARSRTGGRLHTVDVDGTPVDLGGAWVHDGQRAPTVPVFAHLGVDLLPAKITDMFGGGAFLDAGTGTYPDTQLAGQVSVAAAHFAAGAATLAQHRGAAEMTVEQAIAALLPMESPLVRATLARFLSVYDGSSPHEVGLLPFLEFFRGGGAEEHDVFPRGGYGTLIEALSGGLDIRLDAQVTAVRQDGDGVSVMTTDATHRASHVLVTVPLSVLALGAISFDPPLPAPKLAAMSALRFGAFEKVAVAYDRQLWEPSPSGTIVVADENPSQYLSLIDLSHWYSRPILLAVTTGDHARYTTSVPPAQRVDQVHELVRTIAGPSAPAPVASAVSTWCTDPFARGCYSRVPRGADEPTITAALEALAAPFGRVLFAGEATSQYAMSLVDGAWLTGIREAKRLLQAPDIAVL